MSHIRLLFELFSLLFMVKLLIVNPNYFPVDKLLSSDDGGGIFDDPPAITASVMMPPDHGDDDDDFDNLQSRK